MILDRKLEMRESYINQDEHCRFGESDWYEPWTDDRGEIFRDAQKEYGRCVSKVYRDLPGGEVRAVGWVFEKKMRYEDARPIFQSTITRSAIYDAKSYYVREIWVELKETLYSDGEEAA